MFTLVIEGKSRILQRAICFGNVPTPPQSRREPGAVVTIRKGSSQARKRLLHPEPELGLLTARSFSRRKGGKKGGGGGKKAEWDHHEFGKNEAHPLGKIGEYTCIILHGLRVCVKSVMRCGEFLYCSDSSCLTVAGELKQLFLKNYMSCLTRYTNSLLKN